MGCDIHVLVERRTSRDAPWEAVQTSDYPECIDWRNYALFGMLADVRNDAGLVTPICEPRGLPADLSVAVDDEGCVSFADGDVVWLGDHSFSWLTLADLDAFDWSQQSNRAGYLGADAWEAWRVRVPLRDRSPDLYCGYVSGPGIEMLSEGAYASRRSAGTLPPDPYVLATWVETYKALAGRWTTEVIPWLRTLGQPENVRVVFGFDS